MGAAAGCQGSAVNCDSENPCGSCQWCRTDDYDPDAPGELDAMPELDEEAAFDDVP